MSDDVRTVHIPPKEITWPVGEIFGPTIQGEGHDQGVAAHFIRFTGCDSRCSWCDTPHAVVSSSPDWKSTRMGAREITEQLRRCAPQPPNGPRWVVLTGGNPLLYDLTQLVQRLRACGYLIAVETQATRWQDWVRLVDRLCVSPKPPSSGMAPDEAVLEQLVQENEGACGLNHPVNWMFLKVPIFTDADYEWATRLHRAYPGPPLYLTAGNDAGRTVGDPERVDTREVNQVRADLSVSFQWLTELIMHDPVLSNPHVIVQAQMHVLAWGNERGR